MCVAVEYMYQFRTLFRSFPFEPWALPPTPLPTPLPTLLPPFGGIAIRAFFFASLLATRSASVDLICLRSSFGSPDSFSPRRGSPFGTTTVGARSFLCVTSCFVPGAVLQRCTRSLRFANLSFSSSRARSSSTHSRS